KCRCGRADSDAAGAEAADMAAEKRRSFRIRPSDPCDAAVTMYAVPIAMAAARVGNRPMRNGAAQVERFSNFSEPGGENLIPSNYRHRPGSFGNFHLCDGEFILADGEIWGFERGRKGIGTIHPASCSRKPLDCLRYPAPYPKFNC